jgi:hypothetical protein
LLIRKILLVGNIIAWIGWEYQNYFRALPKFKNRFVCMRVRHSQGVPAASLGSLTTAQGGGIGWGKKPFECPEMGQLSSKSNVLFI